MDGFPFASLRASLIASTLSMYKYLSSTHPISGYQRYLHPPFPSCQGASTSALGVSWCHGVTGPAAFANSIAPRKWWFTQQNLMETKLLCEYDSDITSNLRKGCLKMSSLTNQNCFHQENYD